MIQRGFHISFNINIHNPLLWTRKHFPILKYLEWSTKIFLFICSMMLRWMEDFSFLWKDSLSSVVVAIHIFILSFESWVFTSCIFSLDLTKNMKFARFCNKLGLSSQTFECFADPFARRKPIISKCSKASLTYPRAQEMCRFSCIRPFQSKHFPPVIGSISCSRIASQKTRSCMSLIGIRFVMSIEMWALLRFQWRRQSTLKPELSIILLVIVNWCKFSATHAIGKTRTDTLPFQFLIGLIACPGLTADGASNSHKSYAEHIMCSQWMHSRFSLPMEIV